MLGASFNVIVTAKLTGLPYPTEFSDPMRHGIMRLTLMAPSRVGHFVKRNSNT